MNPCIFLAQRHGLAAFTSPVNVRHIMGEGIYYLQLQGAFGPAVGCWVGGLFALIV